MDIRYCMFISWASSDRNQGKFKVTKKSSGQFDEAGRWRKEVYTITNRATNQTADVPNTDEWMSEANARKWSNDLGMFPHPNLSKSAPSATLDQFIAALKAMNVKAVYDAQDSQWRFSNLSNGYRYAASYEPAGNPGRPQDWTALVDVCRQLDVPLPEGFDQWAGEADQSVNIERFRNYHREQQELDDLSYEDDPASGDLRWYSRKQRHEVRVPSRSRRADRMSPIEGSRVSYEFGAQQPPFVPPNSWQFANPKPLQSDVRPRPSITIGVRAAVQKSRRPLTTEERDEADTLELVAEVVDINSSERGDGKSYSQEEFRKDPGKYTGKEEDPHTGPEDPHTGPGSEDGPGH